MLNPSLACQVRASIRCLPEMPYQEMVLYFKKKKPLTKDNYAYFIGFFEECSPRLVKAFMKEQNITRTEILSLLHELPLMNETLSFREAVENGEF